MACVANAQRVVTGPRCYVSLPYGWEIDENSSGILKAHSPYDRETAIYIEMAYERGAGYIGSGELTDRMNTLYREKRSDRSLGFRLEKRYPVGSTRRVGGGRTCAMAYSELSPRTGGRNRLTKYFCSGNDDDFICIVTILAPARRWDASSDMLHDIVDTIVWRN